MLDNLNNVFKMVYTLANVKHLDYEKYGLKEFSTSEEGLEKHINYKNTDNKKIVYVSELALENYLLTLEFETIKIIQSIMYLGRDKKYNKKNKVEEIYSKGRKCFDENGWNSREVEVNQIAEKVCLDCYLLNGLKILEISI